MNRHRDRNASLAPPLFKLLAYGACSLLFAFAFYDRYWKWRDCIADVASSCTLAGAANATAAGQIWAVPAVAFLVLAVKALVQTARARSSG